MSITTDELIEKAKDQHRRGRYEEALISSTSATQSDPDNAEAWWQVARNRMSLGDERNALPALKRTVELAPHFSYGWALYGTSLLKVGDADAAQEAFESALEEDPDQEEALKELADIYSNQNKDKKETDERELSILTRLDDVADLSSNQLNRIGILHYQNKNFFDAIKYWERDVLLSNHPANLFNLGLVYNHPEVSQDADAVDMWRLTANRYPDYPAAHKSIANVLPRLLTLAQNATRQNSTLLPKEQWYSSYLNPFELLNPPEDLEFDDLDTKRIQRLKKTLLQEIELEDGCISWMADTHVDKSKAIGVCEELNNEATCEFHWHVFQNKPLLNFLCCGSHTHFLVDEVTSPLEIIELLEDQDNGFREWLSEAFAKQFDTVLSKAIDQKNLAVLECMLDGRRWVAPSFADKCFEGARRQVDRLLEPMRKERKCADDVMPTVESVTCLLEQGALVDILNMLPTYFRDYQNEAASIIRDLAISCYNKHANTELSKNILQIARRFTFKSAELNHRLDEDFKKIDELIHEERKHEVRLTNGGNKWEITKDGVYCGERHFPANTIASARWGTIITQENYTKSYDFLFAVKDSKGEMIKFTWKASTAIEKNQEYFKNLINAALNYLLPSIFEKIDNRLEAGHAVQIGPCSITEQGVQFETKGWFLSDTRFVPWQRVRVVIENGELVVSDTNAKKARIEISHRLIDNAPVLLYLAHFRNPD